VKKPDANGDFVPNPAEMRQERLAHIRKFWIEGKPPKFFAGYSAAELAGAGIPEACQISSGLGENGEWDLSVRVNQAEFSRRLTARYGYHISPMQVSNWIRRQGMPTSRKTGVMPSEAVPWLEGKGLVKKAAGDTDGHSRISLAEIKRKEADARKAETEATLMERENDEKFVLREVAEATVISVLKKYHSFVKRICERQFRLAVGERLKPDFTDEQLAKVSTVCAEVGKDAIGEIEGECEKAGSAVDSNSGSR